MDLKSKDLGAPSKRLTRRSLAATTESTKQEENILKSKQTKKRATSSDNLTQKSQKFLKTDQTKEKKFLNKSCSSDFKYKQKSITDYISPNNSSPNEPAPSTSKAAKTEKLKETPKRAAKNIKSYDFNETESSQSDKDDTDDEEFVLKKEEDNEEASSELSESESEPINSVTDDELNSSDNNDTKSKSTKKSKQQRMSTRSKNTKENVLSEVPLLDVFNLDEKIEEWNYETEPNSGLYCRPILPALSDLAIQPYLNKKSTKKSTIYDCPFCGNHFTYSLVFKTHLFSCTKNLNVPEYILFCRKYPECPFKGQRRQEMINHYNKAHANDTSISFIESHLDSIQIDSKNSSIQDSALLSTTKKNQLEVSRYYYVDKNQLKYSLDYFNKTIAVNFKRLKFLDDYLAKISYNHFLIEILRDNHKSTSNGNKCLELSNESALKFHLAAENQYIDLKPFEMYQSKNAEPIQLINVCSQVTSLAWCPQKFDACSRDENEYLAIVSLPLKQFSCLFESSNSKNSNIDVSKNKVKDLDDHPNLIYIYKSDLSGNEQKLFGILNRSIGTVSSLRWRPDSGASSSSNPPPQANFIGYLLATSSDGNAYIYLIVDLTKSSLFEEHCSMNSLTKTINKLNVFEPKRQIVLHSRFSYGQCTSGDWAQLNGATQIALGYTSGQIAIFQLNSNFLNSIYKPIEDTFFIYPIKMFGAHLSFIRDLKWCKFNSNILATGSTFSRDLKVWNIVNTEKPFIEYEIFVTEFEFTMHSNHLFIAKETNLKGENHLFVLDLAFNVFNKEKDESRSKASLFYTNGTMNSIDQSDCLNKLLVCDTEGFVILSSSSNPNHWIPKHQLMFNSFSQIVSFQILNDKNDPSKSYSYNSDDKKNQCISIDLERKFKDKKSKPKENANVINSNRISINNLTTIRWNCNCRHLNWYACGSGSGFIFLHKLNELKIESD